MWFRNHFCLVLHVRDLFEWMPLCLSSYGVEQISRSLSRMIGHHGVDSWMVQSLPMHSPPRLEFHGRWCHGRFSDIPVQKWDFQLSRIYVWRFYLSLHRRGWSIFRRWAPTLWILWVLSGASCNWMEVGFVRVDKCREKVRQIGWALRSLMVVQQKRYIRMVHRLLASLAMDG